MSVLVPTDPGSLLWVLQLGAWLAVGFAVGALHFLSLHWSVCLFLAGRAAYSLALQAVRLALLGGALVVITIWFGALPLLVASGGLLLARTVVLRLEAEP